MRPELETLESRLTPAIPSCQSEFAYTTGNGDQGGTECVRENLKLHLQAFNQEYQVALAAPVLPAIPSVVTGIVTEFHVAGEAVSVRWSFDQGQTWTQPIALEALPIAEAWQEPSIDWNAVAVNLLADAAIHGEPPVFESLDAELPDGTPGFVVAVRADATSPPTWLFVADDGTAAFELGSVPAWMEQYVAPWEVSE